MTFQIFCKTSLQKFLDMNHKVSYSDKKPYTKKLEILIQMLLFTDTSVIH